MKPVFVSYAREILKPHLLYLLIPLILSAFTHLWNPIGFPSIHGDEGHYMRRALILLGGGAPQEPDFQYDHPFFGQILLAAMLGLTGYPNSLNLTSNADVHSIEMIHLVPRLLMGVLAIVDTFLIYKIADYRYNRKVAFIAAILFAVMPSSWFIRRIFLESIQLPLLLSSIFFAVYYLKYRTNVGNNIRRDSKNKYGHEDNNNYKHIIIILLSGIFLGLAIFTKIPVFTMIPLVACLIYKNSNNTNKKGRLKGLGLWFIPVILIPAIWPAYAISIGQYDKWIEGISSQATRSDYGTAYIIDFNNNYLVKRLIELYKIDPILVILGVTGIAFAVLKRDFFCLLWITPTLIFFYFLGFVRTFHLILLLPVFCVAAAILLGNILEKASTNRRRIKRPLFVAVSSAIVVFGLLSTTMLITKNVNAAYFELYSFIVQKLPPGNVNNGHYYAVEEYNNSNKDKHMVSVVGNYWSTSGFSWIPKYIYGKEHQFNDFFHRIESQKVILVIDKRFMNTILNLTQDGKERHVDQKMMTELRNIYNKSDLIAKFDSNITERFNFKEYPYYSMLENNEMGQVDVRMNY